MTMCRHLSFQWTNWVLGNKQEVPYMVGFPPQFVKSWDFLLLYDGPALMFTFVSLTGKASLEACKG